MRKVREVLRLRYECKRSYREIAASCGISPGSVGAYLERAQLAGLDWEAMRELSEEQVEARLFQHVGRGEPPLRAAIDYAWLQRELSRTGVTLQLLWGEYEHGTLARSEHPYCYSQFCELFANWRGKRRLSMRQVHRAGEKCFVDYSGKRPHIVDAATGEVRDVELFVAVMGASNYTFAEATLTQQLPDFVASNIRTLEYFGAFLDCGLLCRGFARLRCTSCEHSQLVAFSCKGRGFCPSCMGRRMCATSANLMEDVVTQCTSRARSAYWRRRL